MANRNSVQLLADKFSNFADKDPEPEHTHIHDHTLVLPVENPILVGQKPDPLPARKSVRELTGKFGGVGVDPGLVVQANVSGRSGPAQIQGHILKAASEKIVGGPEK
jgi:hypothetical protein